MSRMEISNLLQSRGLVLFALALAFLTTTNLLAQSTQKQIKQFEKALNSKMSWEKKTQIAKGLIELYESTGQTEQVPRLNAKLATCAGAENLWQKYSPEDPDDRVGYARTLEIIAN